MVPHLLFFYFSSVRILFPVVPMALLLCTEPNRAFVLLSAPVTCSFSHSPSLSPSLYLPLPPSLHLLVFLFFELTIEVQGETCVFATGRGVKRGAENKEQVCRRDSPHLNACLLVVFWLTLSVWSLEFSFQFPSSDVKKMAHREPGKHYYIKGAVPSMYVCFLSIHLSSWQGSQSALRLPCAAAAK